MTRMTQRRILALAFAVGLPAAAAAQHQEHQTPGPQEAASSRDAAACAEGARQVLELVARSSATLDAARQTNSAAEMRPAIERLQALLGEVKARLESCQRVPAEMAGQQAAAEHTAYQAPGASAAAARPQAATDQAKRGHAMPAAPPEAGIDPVCGMSVSEARHKAEYEGQTYYFCSETDRQKFLASPEKYLQKTSAGTGAPRMVSGQKSEPAKTTQSKGLDIAFKSLPDPPKTGDNTFEVTVKGPDRKPITDADVTLRFYMAAMPSMKMPEMRNSISLKHVSEGRYRGTGGVLMAGTWEVTVVVAKGGKEIGSRKLSITAK